MIPPSNQRAAQRIPSLDGLRAISITFVMLSHLAKWKLVPTSAAAAFGDLGVHIFFVLSGYLITQLLLREHASTGTISLKSFYIRRAFRIFPAAFVFIAIAVVVYWKDMKWYHTLAALLYVANMDVARPRIFGHLWSLGIEEQFYLLWPFAVKRWFRNRVVILLCVLGITPFFQTLLHAFRAHNGLVGSLPMFADRLAIGCLLAIFASRMPRISRRLALFMLAAMIFIPFFPANSRGLTLFEIFFVFPLLDVCIAGIVLHVIQTPYWFLNWRPVAWLGTISYSLYLWQEMFCANPNLHWGYWLILPSLGAAVLSYYLVERPMLRLREVVQTEDAAVTLHRAA